MYDKLTLYKNLKAILKFDVDYDSHLYNTKIKDFILWVKDEDVNNYDIEQVRKGVCAVQNKMNGNSDIEILAYLANGEFISVNDSENTFIGIYNNYKELLNE